MGLLSKDIKSMEQLLLHEIKDLYDAEQQLVSALPKMAEKATSARLKSAFQSHLEETKGQVKRLEKVFELLGKEPERETCKAMKGLIAEGEDILKADAPDEVLDAAMIAAAQRVEHYEMAGYGSARAFARHLGQDEVANLLQETLNEEGEADKTLVSIAEEGGVNRQAAAA